MNHLRSRRHLSRLASHAGVTPLALCDGIVTAPVGPPALEPTVAPPEPVEPPPEPPLPPLPPPSTPPPEKLENVRALENAKALANVTACVAEHTQKLENMKELLENTQQKKTFPGNSKGFLNV